MISWLFRVAMISMRTLSSVPAPWKRAVWWGAVGASAGWGHCGITPPVPGKKGLLKPQGYYVPEVKVQQMAQQASRNKHKSIQVCCQWGPNWCDWWVVVHATGLPLPWLSCDFLCLAGHCSCYKLGMLCKAMG